MTNPKECKSETITFTIQRKPQCMVEYKVKSSSEIVKKAHHNAIKLTSKEVSLPGFRKGRVPGHLIIKKFPKLLKESWEKAIADEAFRECQKLVHIPPLSSDLQINFKIKNYSLEEGAEITYLFETEPEVPDIDLTTLEIKEVKRESVDAKKIESTLENIQMFFAEWEKISDHPVKEGDYVVIDVDIIESHPPKKALRNARFEVDKKKMAKWMQDILIGMKIGEVKEGVSKPDDDVSEEEKKATPPKKVHVILKSIEQPKLPPIDDSLAQKMGAKTAADLKKNLESLLNKQADEAVQQAYRNQINEFLLETYSFELPQTLMQKETQFRIKQLANDATFQQRLMAMGDEEHKKEIETIQKQGEKAIRLFYLSCKVIQEQKISISPSEVHQGVKTPLEAMFSNQSDLYNANEESQEQKAIAMSRLILTKVEDFLISKAKIIPLELKEKTVSSKKTSPKQEEDNKDKKESTEKETPKETR